MEGELLKRKTVGGFARVFLRIVELPGSGCSPALRLSWVLGMTWE